MTGERRSGSTTKLAGASTASTMTIHLNKMSPEVYLFNDSLFLQFRSVKVSYFLYNSRREFSKIEMFSLNLLKYILLELSFYELYNAYNHVFLKVKVVCLLFYDFRFNILI